MASDNLMMAVHISNSNPMRDSHALDTVHKQIEALPDSALEDLSSILGTHDPIETLRALYRMAPHLVNPARAAQRFAEHDLKQFMLEMYRVAAVRQILQNPNSAPRVPFREWCLIRAMGSDPTETLGYALQLLERVRPPKKSWIEWLAEVGREAKFRDEIGLQDDQDFAHEATPAYSRRTDAGVNAESEPLPSKGEYVSDDS